MLLAVAALALHAPHARAAAFPLRVAANGRYLVDQAGQPFRLQSDAAWLMSTRATASEVDTYLADRKARGFNTFVLMNLVNTGYGGHEPANQHGDQPFTTAGDFSTPNEAYFGFIDTILDKAAAQGMLVLFFYTYLGYAGGDQGWWSIINQSQNTQTVCRTWGQWLGNRYKNRSNIVWMVGGDYTPPDGEGSMRVHKILEGIRAAGATQIAGAQWGGPDSLATDQNGFSSGPDPSSADINIDTFYGYGPGMNGQTWQTAERAWAHSPALPAILFEPTYENDSNGPSATRESIRAYEYWSVLGGSTAGQCFGTESIWDWKADWQTALASPGSKDVSLAFGLFDSLPWQDFVPSGTGAGQVGRNLVASGQGSGGSRIEALATPGGSWLLAYVPPTGSSATTFAIDLRSMAGPSRARFWNPTNGQFSDIAGASALSNSVAAQNFTTPGDNGTGTNDWLLVIDSAAGGAAGTSGGTGGSGGGSAGSGNTGGSGGSGNTGGGGAAAGSGGTKGAAGAPSGGQGAAGRSATTGGGGGKAAGGGGQSAPTTAASGGAPASSGRSAAAAANDAGGAAAPASVTAMGHPSTASLRSGCGCAVAGGGSRGGIACALAWGAAFSCWCRSRARRRRTRSIAACAGSDTVAKDAA